MIPHDPGRSTARSPLEAHVQELRRRCEAIARVQGGSTDYWQEIAIFRDYVRSQGFNLAELPEEVAARPPDDEGNEHQVWFVQDFSKVIKVSWPGFFGLLVLHRPDEEARASPIAYLERWQLHNDLFGDLVTFRGVVDLEGEMRLIIEQPAVSGEPATAEQIDLFFRSHGWLRLSVLGEVAYFDKHRKVVISDTHRANIIKLDDGLLAPIDLRVQPLSGSMLEAVKTACGC